MTDQPFMGPVLRRTVNTQCFNWEPYTLQQIWQMLQQETGETSWAQVTAWGRMKNLCEDQAKQLRQALDELAAVWPPDKSEASKLYRDLALTMARSLDDSANAAHMNAKALSHLTVGISETRQKIAHLVEQLNARETEQAERERNRLPFWPDSGLIDTQRRELNQAARQIMSDADVIPATAAADFRVPDKYAGAKIETPGTPVDPGATGPGTLESGGGTYVAPTWTVPQPIINPPAPALDAGFVDVTSPEAHDPVLAGSSNPEMPGRSIPSQIQVPGIPGGQTLFSASIPFGSVRTPGAVGPGGTISPPRAPTGNETPSSRSGPASPGRSPTPTASTAGMAAPMVPYGGRMPTTSAGAPQARQRRRQSDPHDPWAVAEGHPPVIEPRDEPIYHDPGPGVIGIDR